MSLNQDTACYVLTNFDVFVNSLEKETRRKTAPGFLNFINELPIESSIPEAFNSKRIN